MSDDTATTNTTYPSITHNGHVITLTKDMTFRVTGPEFDEDGGRNCTYDSIETARQNIDQRVTAAERQKTTTFNAIVRDAFGNAMSLTGINRRDSRVMARPKYEGRYIYPNVTWISMALRQMQDLHKQLRELEKKLEPYRMIAERAYGRIDADGYARRIEALDKEIKEKTEAAEKAELPQSVEEPYHGMAPPAGTVA